MPTAKAAVIEKMAGFFIGKMAASLWNTSTQTVFERTIMMTELNAPTRIDQTAPWVVNFFQTIDISSAGKLARGGDREGEADHEGDVLALEEDAEADREDAEDDRGDLGRLDLLLLARVAAS